NLVHKPDHGWKKVPFILVAQLFAGDREWRTGKASRNQIDTPEIRAIKIIQVLLENLPCRSVKSERFTGVPVNLDESDMLDASLLEAKRLTAGASAKLKRGKPA